MARRAGKYKISERDAVLFDLDESTINTSGTNLTLSGELNVNGGIKGRASPSSDSAKVYSKEVFETSHLIPVCLL